MAFTPDQITELQGLIDAYLTPKKKRIPELPPNSTYGELSLLDRVALWMNSTNKTVYTDLLTVKQIMTTGGTGIIAPVLTGSTVIIEVTAAEAGGNTILRPELEGKTYFLRLEGRPLKLGTQWDLLSGGFKMKDVDGNPYELQEGQVFDADIYELQQSSTGTPAALSSSFVTGKVEVSTNTTLNGVNHANKLISIRAGSTTISIVLPDIATVPEKAVFFFEAQITNDFQTGIYTSSGQSIYMNNTSWSSVQIGKGENLWLYRDDAGWVVFNDFGNYYKNLGKPYPAYSWEPNENELLCDGGELLKVVYPRLWNKIQTSGAALTSDPAVYAANPGMWLDADAGAFKLPDLRKMFLRGLDDGETPGRFQDEAVNISADVRGIKKTGGGTIASTVDSTNPGGGEYDLTQNFPISPKQGDETRPMNTGVMWVVKY